jgi:N utilization substance protein A
VGTRVLDFAAIKLMDLLASRTGAQVRDCVLSDGEALLIVGPGEAGKAVGRGGAHVRELERLTRRRIRIAEYSPDVASFIKGLVQPLEVRDASVENDTVVLTAADSETRGLLIGRNAHRLRALEAVVQRHFPIKEIRVR